MNNLFSTCLSRCGLSQKEATTLLEVSLDTIKKWCSGRSFPPLGIWDALRDYERKISHQTKNSLDTYRALATANFDKRNQEVVDLATEGKSPLELAIAAALVLSLPLGVGVSENGRAARLAASTRKPKPTPD